MLLAAADWAEPEVVRVAVFAAAPLVWAGPAGTAAVAGLVASGVT